MKILIVDDEPLSRHLLKVQLTEWKYDVLTATRCEEALKILEKEDIVFIILDWVMPEGMQGIEMVKRIRQSQREDYIYIVMLTTKSEKKDIIQGVTAGVDDYIRKPFDFNDLRTRIKMGQKIQALKQENMRLKDRMQMQNSHPEAISNQHIFNCVGSRKALLTRIDEEIEVCIENEMSITLMVISIEKLHLLKYTYGFKILDKISAQILKRLERFCSNNDYIGQISDQEFLVVLPNSNQGRDNIIADWIKNAIEEDPVIIDSNINIRLTANIGMVTADPLMPKNAEGLVQLAISQISRQ